MLVWLPASQWDWATASACAAPSIGLSADKLAGTPVAGAADVLSKVMGFAPTIALIVVIIVGIFEVVQTIYRLVKTRTVTFRLQG